MLVKELIEKLKTFDQDIEVTDGNSSLYSICVEPGYWDGCFTKLYQDKSRDDYNVTGCKIVATESKLVLSFMDWEDVLANDPEYPVDYDSKYTEEKYKERVDRYRTKLTRLNEDFNKMFFGEVAHKLLLGYKIVQPKTERIGVYNQMWYIKDDETELRQENKLRQGDCAAVIEMGRFEHIEKEDYIYWQIKE
jgi:hypothetical protein